MRTTVVTLVAGCSFQLQGGDLPSRDSGPDSPLAADAPGSRPDAPDAAPWTADACPSGYITIGTQPTRYRLNTTGRTFWEHHDDCANDAAGMTHLAAIGTTAEAMQLVAAVNAATGLPSVAGFTLVYAGGLQLRDQASPATGWIGVTGGAAVAAAWDSGEPNDFPGASENNNENHLALFRNNQYLADCPGTLVLGAMCECDGESVNAQFAAEVEATRP